VREKDAVLALLEEVLERVERRVDPSHTNLFGRRSTEGLK